MTIYKIAAIATIIGAMVVVWQFVEQRSVGDTVTINTLKKEKERVGDATIDNALKKEKESVALSVDRPEYKNEKNWLLAMYQAAIAMPYTSDKSNALKRVVKSALQSGDFNMAIIAAKELPYASTKAEMLDEVVKAAIQSKETLRYAVVAADNIPYTSSKSSALERIFTVYETYAKQAAPHYSPFEVHLDEKVSALLSEVEQLYGKPIRVERLSADIPMAGKARVDEDGTPIVLLKANSARRIDLIAHELYHLLIQGRDGYPVPKWVPLQTTGSDDLTLLTNQFTFQLYDPILHRAFFREARNRLGIDPGEDFEQQVRQMISDGSIKRMDDGAVVLNYYKTRLELKDRKLFQQLVDGWENQGKHNQLVIGEQLATIVEQVNPLTPVSAVSALVKCLNIFYKGRYTFVQRPLETRQRATYTQNLAVIEFTVARTTASQVTTAPGLTKY